MSLLFSEKEKKLLQKVEDIENTINKLDRIGKDIEKKTLLLEKYRKKIEDERKKNELEIEQKKKEFEREIENERKILKNERTALDKIYRDAKEGNTCWLSTLISDYHSLQITKIVEHFQEKRNPIRIKTSKELKRLIREEIRILKKQNKEYEYLIKKYEEEEPDIANAEGCDLTEEIDYDDPLDNICDYNIESYKRLTSEEYRKLLPEEKSQLALNRYWREKKSKQVLGRDYERYIGYLFEKDGYSVKYFGIEQGMDDLGIDLICRKDKNVILIQCKYWKKDKYIRENVICQLYGTYIRYRKAYSEYFNEKKGNYSLKCMVYTSAIFSEKAVEFAKLLDVELKGSISLSPYPIIKCNKNKNGDKIYHLPYDQQYDTTKIKDKEEFYAMTIKEAEDAGFRRAFRWHGNSNCL